MEKRQAEVWLLTSEGKDVAQNGSHEATVYGAVNPDEGTSQAELEVGSLNSCDVSAQREIGGHRVS